MRATTTTAFQMLVYVMLAKHWHAHHIQTLCHSSQSGCRSTYFECSWKIAPGTTDVGFKPLHSLQPLTAKWCLATEQEGHIQSRRKSMDSFLWLERKTELVEMKHDEGPVSLLRGFRKKKKEKKWKCTCKHWVKTCNVIKTIYKLLLNATSIPMYNTAFFKNT